MYVCMYVCMYMLWASGHEDLGALPGLGLGLVGPLGSGFKVQEFRALGFRVQGLGLHTQETSRL